MVELFKNYKWWLSLDFTNFWNDICTVLNLFHGYNTGYICVLKEPSLNKLQAEL